MSLSATGVVARNQRGAGLISMFLFAMLIVFAAILGFRAVPVVSEYLAVQRIVNIVGREANDGASLLEVRRSFDRRAQIDGVHSVSGRDLEISRRSGRIVVEVSYQRTLSLVANVSLLFDFHVSTLD